MAEDLNSMVQLLKNSLDTVGNKVKDAKLAYVKFITQNPEKAQQLESLVKTSSYLYEAFSKNYENSIFITELVSSACNLFAYINGRIKETTDVFSLAEAEGIVDKIKQTLMVIEFSQTFLEMFALRAGGTGARWAVISLICLVKAILRCILLYVFNSGIQSTSLSFNNNTNAFASRVSHTKSRNTDGDVFYIGPRSGHKMRTLDCSAGAGHSSMVDGDEKVKINLPPTVLSQQEKVGEMLHAVRPLVHLLSVGVFGSTSLWPWLTALITDTSSHALLHKEWRTRKCKFNPEEEKELQRRYANLLLYLLRTPVYDKTVGPRLLRLLSFMSKKVPLARLICDPLTSYLPVWQRVYFYLWAD